MSINGVVDNFSPPNRIAGWVKGPAGCPPIELTVCLHGEAIGTGRAGYARPDLGGDFGFVIETADPITGDDLLGASFSVRAELSDGVQANIPLYSGFREELFRKGHSPYGPRRRQQECCIFTSAGDHNNVAAWVDSRSNSGWDIIVCFYGEDEQAFEELCKISTYVVRQKGGKFPNLKRLYQATPGVISGYKFIWVMDDDIIISPADIEKCFLIARWFNFSVCAPSFSEEGKISFGITKNSGDSESIRLVSFIEVTCPLFRGADLIRFLEVYDGTLIGFGVDFLFCHLLETGHFGRAAIIDSVSVINPHDQSKPGGVREITKIVKQQDIAKPWRDYQRRCHIPELYITTFASIRILSSAIYKSRFRP
jgi:hypothetical protein